ncbi:MAG: T9SS type A sorting domain-containing protein [Fluviicola sp.]|nr:T9SS type A sorting domain-containing protein [Fluviicola sp.]
MKKFLLLLAVFGSFVTYSQEKCAAHTKHNERLANDPAYAEAMHVAQGKAKAWQQTHQNGTEKVTLTIPVVVHVLYKNAAQNVSLAQIQSQIDVLNTDYRALNQIDLPAYFDSLKADIDVEFCLASVDPDGNPTDGITRTSTTGGTLFGYFSPFNDDMKYDSLGGKNCWPTDKYLNLWVGELFPGLLGYAQFPGDPKVNADGVVITTTAFGTTGNVDPISAGGRTATHEIGHWMGLYHIWGDEDACTGSDTIADTPNMAAASNQGCDSLANTCSNEDAFWGSFDPTDMVFNYMDYSSDTCMGMFTKGQKMRMHGFLNTDPRRMGLATSNGCAFMGIKEDVESMFTLSPNPTTDNVRILFNTGDIATVQIVNAQGQLIAVYDALSTGAEIDLSNLEVGVYLVQMMKNEKLVGIERLVKH